MNPTKQFSWKDRDTAGHDLIQLAYHAPSFISRRALELLTAIRSKEIIPELVAITLDSQRNYWQRVYALRAISETEEDFYFPELEPLVREAFAKTIKNIRHLNQPYPENLWLRYDFAEVVNGFASENPSNQIWFLALLDSIDDSYVLTCFLKQVSTQSGSDTYRQKLSSRLRQAFDKEPQFISLHSVASFYHENAGGREWCEKHFDTILALCLKESDSWKVWHLAEKWEQLRDALAKNVEGWETSHQNRLPRFRGITESEAQVSPAKNFLEGSYLSALEGNTKAFSRLLEAARLWKGFIPFRAVATHTHYLGKLQDHYNISPILSGLALYSDDDWGDEHSPISPIRYEACRALSNKPSAAAWETVVEAFFIKPRNDLSLYQLGWVRYMTDVLSGDMEAVEATNYVREAGWFMALSEVSVDEAKKLIESVF